jgi:hypothetical protein
MVCAMWLAFAEGAWLRVQTATPFRPVVESFRDPRHVAAVIVFLHAASVSTALGGVFVLALFNRLLRSRWASGAAWIVVYAALSSPGLRASPDWRVALSFTLAPAVIAACVLIRFGLLAFVATAFTAAMLTRSPAALEFSAWYANRSLIALFLVVAVGVYGAYCALVRRPHAVHAGRRFVVRT